MLDAGWMVEDVHVWRKAKTGPCSRHDASGSWPSGVMVQHAHTSRNRRVCVVMGAQQTRAMALPVLVRAWPVENWSGETGFQTAGEGSEDPR